MPLWWSGSPPAFSFTKVFNRCFLWGISVFYNIRRKKEMNEEWRKLSVTACVHRSCFYYDRKVYSEWFAILSQLKICLGEEPLPFAKGHLIFRLKTLHSLCVGGGLRGSKRRSVGKLKEVTRRKVVALVLDLSAEGRVWEATSLKGTQYIISASEGRCLGNYTWRENKVLWMSSKVVSSPNSDKHQHQTWALAVLPLTTLA